MRAPTEDDIAIIARDAPDVFDMADKAKKDGVDHVIFMIDAFGGEPELLHAVVWYLTSCGLLVHICGERP